ncbi:MAG: DUF86 domain-containing protein [Synechococcaceae cyanobacterium SM2_3_1]|nr:DUF86 domain-containing protein [Synechococcaceae cyanobacterium SM2_3_1]
MLDASQKALQFTQNRSRLDLDQDEILSLEVVRLIEILGEAAKNVSQQTRDRTPNIPWRQIAGTRDRLSHTYFDVNLDIIWDIVSTDIPQLIPQLEKLLQDPKV